MLVAPSRDGLDAVRTRIREYLGWEEVRRQLKDQPPQDPLREEMLATWTEQSRKRIPDAIRQAWLIVVSVNEQNEIHAFKITVGSDPLFTTVKADKRSRIQESAISAEAMLPGGPYDLWREDEPSRRVKDLVSAFAENPKLPRMLRQKEILDTIDQGVRDGIFVALLARPDKSITTWWRMAATEPQPNVPVSKPKGVYTCSAALEPSALQDLVDVLPAIVKAAAGVQLRFQLHVSLGSGQSIEPETVISINKLLGEVSSDLCLRV